MKKIVFIYSKKGIERLIRYSIRHDCTIISLTAEIDFILSEKKIKFKNIQDYGITRVPYEKIHTEALVLFRKWGRMKIGKSELRELLTIEGIPLWKTIESEATLVNLEIILNYCRIVEKILEAEQPGMIMTNDVMNLYLVQRDRIFFHDIIKCIAKKKDILFQTINVRSRFGLLFQFIMEKTIEGIKIYRKHQRRRLCRLNLEEGKKRVIFFHYGGRMNKTLPIQGMMQKRGYDAVSICTGGVMGNMSLSHFKGTDLNFAYVDVFMDRRIRKEIKRYRTRLMDLWRHIKGRRSEFSYKGIDLSPVFFHQLRYFFRTRLIEIVSFCILLDEVFKKIKPGMIVTVTESIPFGRAAVLSAKNHRIKSLLLQHATNLEHTSRMEPLADYIGLWSEMDKKTISDKINKKRIFVTGSSKQEIMDKEMKGHDVSQIKEELGIPGRRKIIVFAARFPVTRDLFRIRDLQNILRGAEDLFALIKIHPAEMPAAVKTASGYFDHDNMIFIKDFDFVKLLSIADVVISTEECTTCSDAIMVRKPVITLLYEKSYNQMSNDPTDYGSDPPFLRAKNEVDLKDHINDLLYKKETIRKIKGQMESFNRNHGLKRRSNYEVVADFIGKKI